jgi:hypothetical protein
MTSATLVSLLAVKTLILGIGVLTACLLFRVLPIRSPGVCRMIWGGVLLLGVFGAGFPVTISIHEKQTLDSGLQALSTRGTHEAIGNFRSNTIPVP